MKAPTGCSTTLGTESKGGLPQHYLRTNISLRQTYLILDSNTGRVMCVLACPPDNPTWTDTHKAASDYLKENGPKCLYPTRKDKDSGEIKIPRRGNFGALSCGISHGGGQTVCVAHLCTICRLSIRAGPEKPQVQNEEKCQSSRRDKRPLGIQENCRPWI